MSRNITVMPSLDVLVLGGGLAGLRAAWAAMEANPRATAAVAMPLSGPSGSSFANPHDRLGLHVPVNDTEREAFCAEAAALAPPGSICPELAMIVAQEAEIRCQELQALGVEFVTTETGSLRLHPSCFSPNSRRAVIFQNLAAVCAAMTKRVKAFGVRLLPGLTAVSLVRESGNGPVLGALLEDAAGRLAAQPARSVIAAMGGPAILFRHNQSGRGSTGCGHGLLAAIGTTMANTAYLQWVWTRTDTRGFWPIWNLLDGVASVRDASGRLIPLPDDVRLAAAQRATHCPFGHGLADAAIDHFLLESADDLGVAAIVQASPPGDALFNVALTAHAANGGAVIDGNAAASVPGLYAVGECATGMHGANRIGGAMAAACLVFGARAGRAAGTGALAQPDAERKFIQLLAHCAAQCGRDLPERSAIKASLACALQRYGLPRKTSDATTLINLLESYQATVVDSVAAAQINSALVFARARLATYPPTKKGLRR